MEIRDKLYPYPVLSPESDDYVRSTFLASIEVTHEGYSVVITMDSVLDDAKLLEMISNGEASYVYHIECAQTGYRKAICTSEPKGKYIIADSKLNGRLQICPFVVAAKDITEYVNPAFNEDYRGFKFFIEAGCVLAVGEQADFDINKERDDFANTKSIFVITKNVDALAQTMEVDYNHKKITIKLPTEDYKHYRYMSRIPEIQSTLNSLLIFPTLVFVLGEINKRSEDDRYTTFSDYGWYKSLKKVLKTRFGRDLEKDSFQENEIVLYAQGLINHPLSGALNYLAMGNGETEEGEDEE